MDYSHLGTGNKREPEANVVNSKLHRSEKKKNKEMIYKKNLFQIAVTEVILGSICIIFAAIVIGLIEGKVYTYKTYYLDSRNQKQFYTAHIYVHTTGEGIWCGIWILVVGALGIRIAQKKVSQCMIICHMSLGIVASVFAGIMLIIDSIQTKQAGRIASNIGVIHLLVLYCILCLSALISLVLTILSAVYSCSLIGWCETENQGCNCCCYSPQSEFGATYGGQVIFSQQPQRDGKEVIIVSPQSIGSQENSYVQQPSTNLGSHLASNETQPVFLQRVSQNQASPNDNHYQNDSRDLSSQVVASNTEEEKRQSREMLY